MQFVDAHQHFWDLSRNYYPWLCDDAPIAFRYGDYSALRRSFLPDDYRAEAERFDVIGTVHIEAEFDEDNPMAELEWLSDLKRKEGLPTVMVAQARLDDRGRDGLLAAYAAHPSVRGVRHKPASAPHPDVATRGAPGSMDDPDWRAGFALLGRYRLSFDLQTPWWHFDAAHDLARDFPNTTIIINHTGLPEDRSEGMLAQWADNLRFLAACPNVVIKISGLGVPGVQWTADGNARVVLTAIGAFGTDRVMFASNYPVDSLVASFATIFDGFLHITAALSQAERAAMFCDNARRFYRMEDE